MNHGVVVHTSQRLTSACH